MARSRPLVDGFLERISVKAFDKYKREITGLVRQHHGVYALYKNDHLYYVGLAGNLRSRIKQHVSDRHANRWNRFSLYLVRKVDHIKEIESLLLRIASPAGNKQGGRLRKAINLKRQFRRMMVQSQRAELAEIFSDGFPRHSGRLRMKRAGASAKRGADRSLRGMFSGGKRIYAHYRGRAYKAWVFPNGRIKFNGDHYDSPSAVAATVTRRPTNGWAFWHYRDHGEMIRLTELRK
jgi:hypothetical protein